MTGIELKRILEQSNVSKSEISRRMGTIPQNLDSYFDAQDVKSGTLERIAEALSVPISYFYDGTPYGVQHTEEDELITIKSSIIQQYTRQIAIKDEQIGRLHDIISNLSKTASDAHKS